MKKTTWEFSAENSSIQFKIKYYTISTIQGSFLSFKGSVLADENFTDPEVLLSAEAISVNADDQTLNKAMRSEACLDVIAYPLLEFNAFQGCHRSEGGIWELTGNLSIRGITKQITMVVSQRRVKRKNSSPVMLFNLFGSLSRKEFALSQNEQELHDTVLVTAMIELKPIP